MTHSTHIFTRWYDQVIHFLLCENSKKFEVMSLCQELALLKKSTWDPHGTHVGTMWVLCGTLVGPSRNHVGTMWDSFEKLLRDLIATMWVPCGSHMTKLKKIFMLFLFAHFIISLGTVVGRSNHSSMKDLQLVFSKVIHKIRYDVRNMKRVYI